MSFRKGFWFHDNGISSIPSFFIVVKGERERKAEFMVNCLFSIDV